ncbi:L-seryl-tRNA(Sec) selenium transferase [Miniphocaeibacter halophilus]|uniref:L-seryl-tRNA(Sec) selenium transferase n=1 Tax=Miniphocaeibacter halophilus TaxID=2931922 RepID=A0AC61MT49_9FIRM|nr:L-seryl-tRNA(Sec) selenium transferase [Miniphocaeibacter halophilus]QQK08687.1 L-seryl-tRNA(Sec) selenium transferase [Miniphocaeibacter halophilus]
MNKNELFRKIPSVEEILILEEINELDYPRALKTEAAREVLASIRKKIANVRDEELSIVAEEININSIIKNIITTLEKEFSSSLKKVINGTGTILHTNLGRSLISESIKDEIWKIASGYSNLEYDLDLGQRGSRYSHVTKIIKLLLNVEDVLVVNNNAAAVLLVLSTFAKDEEVIVSRGELVEVGGAFRIPSVMAMSGAKLVEVGSTNKTRISDYEEAITENTKLLMKVHTSNYKMIGFTEAVSNKELKKLGEKYDLPVVEDLGSGVYFDLEEFGLKHEPTIRESINSGIDLVTFSGDKLLGGPQAGVIVGKKEYIDKMKKNQLLRALRVDKITLASLEATLKLYFDEEKAKKEIPAMRMISYTVEELEEKAKRLKSIIEEKEVNVELEIKDEFSTVGGGSMPGEEFPTKVLTISSEKYSVSKIEEKLRLSKNHIIGRVKDNNYMLDLRTIQNSEFEIIAEEIEKNLK